MRCMYLLQKLRPGARLAVLDGRTVKPRWHLALNASARHFTRKCLARITLHCILTCACFSRIRQSSVILRRLSALVHAALTFNTYQGHPKNRVRHADACTTANEFIAWRCCAPPQGSIRDAREGAQSRPWEAECGAQSLPCELLPKVAPPRSPLCRHR
jgi:hypothetical protein